MLLSGFCINLGLKIASVPVMATSTSTLLASSVEKTNGAKLSRLLIDGGTAVLRNVFDHYHAPANLVTDLNSHRKTLHSLLRRRILKKPQWDILFPPPGVAPDSKSFDITLLFLLLTNICGLSCPSSGWHSKPHASDNSFEANLARIKFYRNELYGHVTTTSVDESTFNNLWQEISSVLVALGLDKAEIDRLKDEHFGEEDYIDTLLDWANSEEDIKSQLRDIRRNQTETQEIVSKVLQTLQENKSKLEELREGQAETREVVQEQRETLERERKKQERERSDKILKNLMKAEFKGDIEHHVKRFQEGTREWIFKKVEDWLNDRNSPNRVMVISGNAGMGKSVISAIICKRIQEAGRLSGSHFCQHNNARYSKPQLMLQSLAIHLSRTLPEYKRALVEQLSRNLGLELNSMGVEELFTLLFMEPLTKVSNPGESLLMVVDGLDESEYKGRNDLLNVVANQFCKLPEWIRLLVTTRPEINIADSLKRLKPIILEENKEENIRDIKLFLEMRLSHQMKETQKTSILENLVKKSEGVFLYAYYLIDFIEENVPFLTLEHLEGSLPLGISSVYLCHFKRLEKELCEELKIEEEQVFRFLSALTASREPLPIAFVSNMFDSDGKSFTAHRTIKKAIACISTLLPLRNDRLHFFHKSVKDWLSGSSVYGDHEFILDEKKGHEILFNLCKIELENVKRRSIHNCTFSDTETYALQHGVQHMIEVDSFIRDPVTTQVDGLIEAFVTDLKLVYAKLCVNSNCPSEDLHNVQKHVRPALPQEVCSNLDLLQDFLRKHSFLLRDHPQLFFQSLVNEGLPELSSMAASILDNDLSHVSYLKYVHTGEGNGAVKARFYGSHRVACFDVSPDMNFMVCECRDGTVHLWSLKTGNIQWKRPSFITRQYEGVHPYGWNSDFGAYRPIGGYVLTFYNSVIFHPNGKYVLPGNLRNVYTLSGDCVELFIDSECKFAHCVFPKDKKAMLTDRFDNPKQLSLWSMEDGTELNRFTCEETISAFTISEDSSKIAFGDLTGSIYLQQIDRRNAPVLQKRISKACGLMHFSPDGEVLCCGHLPCEIEHVGVGIYGWMFDHHQTFTFCDFTNLVALRSSGKILLWPIQSGNSIPDYFSNWVDDIRSVFPCFSAGFFKKLNGTTILTGGPSFNYIVAVNVDVLSATNSASTKMKVREIVMSVEGDTMYSISSCDNDYNDSKVLVTVVRISSKEILTEKTFICGSVSLLPTKSGIVLSVGQDTPQLWSFDLLECIKPLAKLGGTEKLTFLSNEAIACQRHCRTMTPEDFWGLKLPRFSEDKDESLTPNVALETEISDFSPEVGDVSSDEEDALTVDDSSWVDDSTRFIDPALSLGIVTSIACESCRMLDVDIFNAVTGEFVSSMKTTVIPKDKVHSVLVNLRGQILLCFVEEIVDEVYEEKIKFSLSENNHGTPIWWRHSQRIEDSPFDPYFIFSPSEEFLITWGSLDSGYGLHILDTKTGKTCHTFVEDHDDIVDCKFVVNGDILISCTRDNFLRLLNVRSGEQLSMLDIGEQPFSLGACLSNHLVAIGLSGTRMKLVQVELPRAKEVVENKG